MSETQVSSIGKIVWTDLTVPNAEEVREFYQSVLGWQYFPVGMKGYDDYCVHNGDPENPVAGICHQRGPNSNVPAQWLITVQVENVENAAAACTENGGKVLDGPRSIGKHQFCIIQDPAGAVMGLIAEHAGE